MSRGGDPRPRVDLKLALGLAIEPGGWWLPSVQTAANPAKDQVRTKDQDPRTKDR